MILDSRGVRPSDSKIYVVAALTRPVTVEYFRTFLGMIGCLRRLVQDFIRIAALLTDILRNRDFTAKKDRKSQNSLGPPSPTGF